MVQPTSSVATWWRQMTDRSRLLLAGKTALAAAIAWVSAPYVPFADAQYAYYAPLGVLVSMYPTVAASAKSGVQALLGLSLGIGLGVAGVTLVLWGVPALVAMALVVGIGVALGGVRALGAGREWVAVAALFVMLLSGRDVDGYSLSYLVTMAWGVVVGVVVNLVVIPPLYLKQADEQLSALRDALHDALVGVADEIEQQSVDATALAASAERLNELLREVDSDVRSAQESSRANPRARRHRGEQRSNDRRLRSLERMAFHAQNLIAVLARLAESGVVFVDADARRYCAASVRSSADLVAAFDGTTAPDEQRQIAEQMLSEYLDALAREEGGHITYRSDRWTVGLSLRRIIDASMPFSGPEQT
ncbi:FUSC family protein [Microbacterium sp. NPDC076911]|uniref:FUSC family protein n=1 Tax=Microbacterium sp. NPDC076911 TaxID=3154958 RepID=UPI003422B74D